MGVIIAQKDSSSAYNGSVMHHHGNFSQAVLGVPIATVTNFPEDVYGMAVY